MRKFAAITLSGLLMISQVPTFASDTLEVQPSQAPIYYNGEEVVKDETYPLISHNGVIYLPLTFENMQMLGIESEWSDQIGLNLSTDGTMYKPDETLEEITNIKNTAYEQLNSVDGYADTQYYMSSSLEYSDNGYLDTGLRHTFEGSEITFNKYFMVENGLITQIEYGTREVRHNNAIDIITTLCNLYGNIDSVSIDNASVDMSTELSSISELIDSEDYSTLGFKWVESAGTITATFTGYLPSENGSFTVRYTVE